MRYFIALVFVVSAYGSNGLADDFQDRYPTYPNVELTPGKLCENGQTRRYPERIAYCQRNVDRLTKKLRFQEYDQQLGYQTGQMNRGEFKIDHYLPLCMGGSNHSDNLWPQHRTVYEITDPMEPLACEKMAAGLLKQADAIELIQQGKNNLKEVPRILLLLQNL